MRIALAGLGDIACKAYLPIVANHPDITPVLCTRAGHRLEALSKQYRISEAYTDFLSMLASKPDAVMIHSNTESHAQLAVQCLTAGIPTFVDKPLSYHLAECERLLDLAAQKNTPLAVGFNRRCAPLIQPLAQAHSPTQIRLQKNRANQPDQVRVFIYDDFIHVLDTLRFLTPGAPGDLQVFAQGSAGLLAAVQVHWQQGETALSGSMNRISGVTEERLEFFAERQKWQIDNLASGIYWQDNKMLPLGFNDWESTLYKRGFVTMINRWVAQVSGQTMSDHDDILATHTLCETLVTRVEALLDGCAHPGAD